MRDGGFDAYLAERNAASLRSAGEPIATELCAIRANVSFAASFCQPANAFAQRDDG